MNELEIRRRETFKALCNRIVFEFPEAAGLAVIELDCGCMYACGFSFTGDAVGSLQGIDSRGKPLTGAKALCLACRKKGAVSGRIVQRFLVWPGEEDEKPDHALRELIGSQIFGPGFQDPDFP